MKVFFRKSDGLCLGVLGTDPSADEFVVDLPFTEVADAVNNPSRYQFVNDIFAERSAWVAENEEKILSFAKDAQNTILRAACAAAITGGFTSSALGSIHTYPSTQTDQNNLAVNVTHSLYPGLPGSWTTLQICRDSLGEWDYRPHTAEQIQQVGLDGKTIILAYLVKFNELKDQVINAVNVSTVQAITW